MTQTVVMMEPVVAGPSSHPAMERAAVRVSICGKRLSATSATAAVCFCVSVLLLFCAAVVTLIMALWSSPPMDHDAMAAKPSTTTTGRTGWTATLPAFSSQKELDADSVGWRSYLDAVYGATTTYSFPINISAFNMFYLPLLPEAARISLSGFLTYDSPGVHCAEGLGQVYSRIDGWFDPALAAQHRGEQPTTVPALDVVWVNMYEENRSCGWGAWPRLIPDPPLHLAGRTQSTPDTARSPLSVGFPSHARVEVMHTCCDGSNNGYFSYLAIGSGVFVDLGKTLVFADHMPAFGYFGFKEVNSGSFASLVAAARAKGWDTLQFTHRCEGKYKYEILDVRPTTSASEGTSQVCRHHKTAKLAYHSGWGGQAPCECTEESAACLNCLVNNVPFPPCPSTRASPMTVVNECTENGIKNAKGCVDTVKACLCTATSCPAEARNNNARIVCAVSQPKPGPESHSCKSYGCVYR